ncbi:MAG: AMP-binding protein [Actinomycetota bacterium]|nr:AMP-binding protein [Actinomycetota bacterium]
MRMAALDILALHASARPNDVAVIDHDRHMALADFNELVNRYGNVLLDCGVRAGEKVLWTGQNSLEVVAINHASRKVGGVCVPMNYRLAPDEAQYVIENADAVVVLFDIEQTEQLESIRDQLPLVRRWISFRAASVTDPSSPGPAWADDLEVLAEAAATTEPEPEGQDDAAGTTMIYTSGTTGKPKGTVRRTDTSEQAAKNSAEFVALMGWNGDDVYLSTGPLYHSAPLGFMLAVQALGGSVVIQRHFDPEEWLRLVETHRVTTSFSAPTPIRRVVDLPPGVVEGYDTSSLQRLLANAAPWPFELKRKYVERINDTSLFEVYGSTELGVNTLLLPPDQMRKPGSCGRPIPGVTIELIDDEGNVVTEPMQPGELFVKSEATFATYYKDAEKYENGRRGDFLSVGDIAYFDDEGYFYICDRKNDMIISGGVNIYPAETEAVLVAHPDIADAAVFGIPDEEWGEAVHAVITLYPGHEAADDDIAAFCREHLAGYKVPRTFDRMDEIPRSASGKILKRELREPYWAGRTSRVG